MSHVGARFEAPQWRMSNAHFRHIIDPSLEEARIIGCAPGGQDKDAWPAYACMMLAETGIVVLTLLKLWVDPIGDADRIQSCCVLLTSAVRRVSQGPEWWRHCSDHVPRRCAFS